MVNGVLTPGSGRPVSSRIRKKTFPAEAGLGRGIEIDADAGRLRNRTTGAEHGFAPLAGFVREIVDAGGLMPHLAARRDAS